LSTRIGLLSDIHADAECLELALQLLRKRGIGYNQMVCMGDLVEKGDAGDRVIALIKQHGIACIAGNHDREAENNLRWFVAQGANQTELMAQGRLLSEQSLKFLESLPNLRLLKAEGLNILMAHGAPFNEALYLFPGSSPLLYKQAARDTQEAGANILLVGHTHIPMQGEIYGVKIFNPGSVCGRIAYGSGTCGVLTLPECKFEVFRIADGAPAHIHSVVLLES
jgi:putative phosphoesterase